MEININFITGFIIGFAVGLVNLYIVLLNICLTGRIHHSKKILGKWYKIEELEDINYER